MKNRIPQNIDSIDISILIYLSENGNTLLTARPIKNICEDLKIKASQSNIAHRFRNLAKKRLIKEGVKTSRYKGYFITDEGENFLINPELSYLKN